MIRRRVLLAALALFLVGAGCSHIHVGLARDCRGHDLVVAGAESDGQGGQLIGLRNVSTTTCAMRGIPPKLTGTSDAGSSEIPITERLKTPLVPKAGNLKPREIGRVVVGPALSCHTPGEDAAPVRTYHDVQLFVRGGGEVSLTNVTLDIKCGARASQLGIQK